MKLGYLSYLVVIVLGLAIAFGVFLKLILGFDIDSDWFWMLAGMGLAVEAIVTLQKQKRFDRKYKIIER